VAERWTGPTVSGRFTPVATVQGIEEAMGARRVILERLTIAPLGLLEDRRHAGAIVIIESGTMRLRLGSADEIERLSSGAMRVFDPWVAYTLWNASQEPATALVFSVRMPLRASSYAPAPGTGARTGIDLEPVAGGATLGSNVGTVLLHVGHAVADPGTRIRSHVVTGAEVVYVVEGRIDAVVDDGYLWVVEDNGTLASHRGAVEIRPRQATATDAGNAVTYTVAGSGQAVFWYFTLVPVESQER
jgi:hypothetical protein